MILDEIKKNSSINKVPDKDSVDFSIVLISYKHDAFFMDALESILNQKYERKKMELIVICKSYGAPINFLKTQSLGISLKLVIDDNFKIGPKFRKAIEASKYDWIVILDDDDLWHPYKLTILSSFIQKDKTVGYIHNSKVYINEKFSINQIKVDPILNYNSNETDNFPRNKYKTFSDCEHNESSIAFKKSIIKSALDVLSDLEGSVDTFLYLSARGQDSKQQCIDDKLTYFRIRDGKNPSFSNKDLNDNLIRQLNSYRTIQMLHFHTSYTLNIIKTRIVTNEIKLVLLLHFKKDLKEKAILLKTSLQLKLCADPEYFFLILLLVISMVSTKLANRLYSLLRNIKKKAVRPFMTAFIVY